MRFAFKAAPLGVVALGNPCPGGPDLLQLSLHLGPERGMLEGPAGRCHSDLDEVRLLPQFLLMDEHGMTGRVKDGQHPAGRRRRRIDGLIAGIQVAPVAHPEV
jgi:hypothetical protein